VKRRELLKQGLAAGAAAALAGCRAPGAEEAGAPAVQGAPRLQWRLVSSFPRGLDTIYGSAEVLAERVAALTEGRFRIRVYPAGEIVPGLQVMDAVQQGTVQMGQTASYYFTGKNPALAFDTCFPFGLTARQQDAWLDEGGGRELVDQLFADFSIVTLPAGNTGAQMGGWFKRPVESLTSLRGLKMRIPGVGGEVMDRLGVTVQVLAGGDIYPALERGAIDATEWVGPYDDEKLGFHKVARYYYYPGWWEPGPSLSFYVHAREWQRLPATYQEALRSAASAAARSMMTRYDAKNAPALDRLLAQGTELRRFPDELMRAAQETARAILEQHAARDGAFRRVYDSWVAFRDASFRWFGTAELGYAEFAFPRPAAAGARATAATPSPAAERR
jgi:TRAP-type mannitol/chloroaromatic compound transport system substrate-binding protein